MPAFREQAIRYVPRSVSDTVDGDNSPSGAMASMQNLIWSPDSPGVLVCRRDIRDDSLGLAHR